MKVSRKLIGLVILVVAVIALLVVYNLYYTPTMEEVEKLEKETETLKKEEERLDTLFKNMPYYKKEIERFKEEDSVIIAHFPQNVLEENEIRYALDLENDYEIYFSALSYGNPTTWYRAATKTKQTDCYFRTLSTTYQATYSGLKEAINAILANNDHRNVETLSASFDPSTGELTGTLDARIYYIIGTENKYLEPYIPDINTGKENIFNTVG